MRKLLIRWGHEALAKLVEASLSGATKDIAIYLLGFQHKVIELLTDDDKDNSKQIKALLKSEVDEFNSTLKKLSMEL